MLQVTKDPTIQQLQELTEMLKWWLKWWETIIN